MTIVKVLNEIKEKIKVNISKYHVCPICKKRLPIGVETDYLNSHKQNQMFRHILLHGSPLHAIIVYIDANNMIRSVEGSESIEIMRNQETFSEILKKWANPY